MTKIIRPKANFPYGLHDARIHKIEISNNRISFFFPAIFQYQDNAESAHRARISFLDVDIDECDIYIFKCPDKKGRFKGRRYSLDKFAKKFPQADLEIITECYHGYDTIWSGWFYRKKKSYYFHINIWTQGDILYEIGEPLPPAHPS